MAYYSPSAVPLAPSATFRRLVEVDGDETARRRSAGLVDARLIQILLRHDCAQEDTQTLVAQRKSNSKIQTHSRTIASTRRADRRSLASEGAARAKQLVEPSQVMRCLLSTSSEWKQWK